MLKITFFILLVLPLSLVSGFQGKISLRHLEDQPWNYNQHGADWAGDCVIGHQQSPVEIITRKTICDSQMHFHLDFAVTPLEAEITDKGYTLEVDGELSTLKATTVDHMPFEYNAAQFHFHAPSEHVIDGKRYDLEMHIVHKLQGDATQMKNRTIAVVGLLFEVDEYAEPNPLIDALHFDHVGDSFELDLGEVLVPEIGTHPAYYAYEGSLTTPPCNELVNWFVVRQILKITPEQLKPIRDRYEGNMEFAHGNGDNRDLQELYGRKVKLGGVYCGPKCRKV